MLHHRSRTLHEQAPKVAVAAFTDAEQGGLAARAVLAWDQPDRRRELPRIGELPRIAEFDRQSAGRDGSNPRNLEQTTTLVILAQRRL